MKKLLLASAIAALSVSAQAAPQVYGKAFLTVDYQDKGATETTALNSNASRIGIKGSEALTANTDVVYQLEYRVEVDNDGTGGDSNDGLRNFESRDTYLGLSNKQYGTFLAGRLSSIDGMIDYANVTQGGVIGGDGVVATFDADRLDNAFAYVSPNYNGLNFLAMYQTDGSDDTDGSLANGGFGVGAKYEPNGAPYRAGITYIKASNPQGDFTATRVSGAYDVNSALTVGALYQVSDKLGIFDDPATFDKVEGSNAKKESVATVSATYKTATPWTVYGQLDFTDNKAGVDGSDQTRLVIGGQYAFNKATTGHVYAGAIDHKPSGAKNEYGIGGGLEYKF